MFEEQERERILSKDEIQKIFQAIDKADARYHHLKDIMIVALNTAMRKGEILNMKKDWVNLKTGIITVPRYAMKRKRKDKRVPINFAIRPILSNRLKQNPKSEYVFVNPKTGKQYWDVSNGWTTIINKAGFKGKPNVDKIRFHDLRHTAATMLARSGKDIKFIAQYLGHTDVKTSARYIHYDDKDLQKGAENLAELTSNFTTPKTVSL